MKKYLKKIKQMSFLMAMVMLLTSVASIQPVMSVYGATTTKDSLGSYDANDDGTNVGVDFTQGFETQYGNSVENESSQDTKVYVSQASTFSVTIPKTIILSGVDKNATYVVGVKGNISATDKIYVKPEESFLMKQIGKDDITALVTQDKKEFAYSDGVRENVTISSNGTIVANDMTAGSWNGSFIFNISLNEEPIIIITAIDENGIDLNAKATYILGNDKETLVKELVDTGMISNSNEVTKLINVSTNEFENQALATIDVSKFANIGDKIAIFHYNETTNEWDFITTCEVDDTYQINANFTSFSPIAFMLITDNHSHFYDIIYHTHKGNSTIGGDCYVANGHTHNDSCTYSSKAGTIHGVMKTMDINGAVFKQCMVCGARASGGPLFDVVCSNRYTTTTYTCGNPINTWKLNCTKTNETIDSKTCKFCGYIE